MSSRLESYCRNEMKWNEGVLLHVCSWITGQHITWVAIAWLHFCILTAVSFFLFLFFIQTLHGEKLYLRLCCFRRPWNLNQIYRKIIGTLGSVILSCSNLITRSWCCCLHARKFARWRHWGRRAHFNPKGGV